MKVLLVNPDDTSGTYLAKRPPMGIAYVGTMLHKAGHSVKLLDMRVKKYNLKAFRKILKEFKPELVGLMLLGLSFKKARELTKIVKTESSASLLIGGPESTLLGKEIMEDMKELDYQILGEGEYSTLELVTKLEKNQDLSDIPGLLFRKNGEIQGNEEPKTIEDLDSLPIPEWNLFDLKAYKRFVKNIKLPIVTSRGCPYSCKFCDSVLINKGYRVRSPKNIVDELEYNYKKFGTKNFQIFDDNFPVYRDRVIDMCNEILKRNLKIKWVVGQGFSPCKGDYELFKKMHDAGCIVVFFGTESADDEILRAIRKPHTVAQARQAIKDAKRAGIIVKAPFLSGLPKSTFKKELKYIDFFKETGIDITAMGHLVPYPRTAMYDYVKKEGHPLMDIDKMHETVTSTTGTNNSALFKPAFDTPEYPFKERVKMLKLFQRESELHLLKNKFGKPLGTFFFWISRIQFIRLMGIKFLDLVYSEF